jgi:hypothetical protein
MKNMILGLMFLVSGSAVAGNAVQIQQSGCGLLDGSGNYVYTNQSRTVVTPSEAGVTILKCFADNIRNNTGSAVRFNNANTGVLCVTQSGSTNDWSETVSASGQAILTCKVHN